MAAGLEVTGGLDVDTEYALYLTAHSGMSRSEIREKGKMLGHFEDELNLIIATVWGEAANTSDEAKGLLRI